VVDFRLKSLILNYWAFVHTQSLYVEMTDNLLRVHVVCNFVFWVVCRVLLVVYCALCVGRWLLCVVCYVVVVLLCCFLVVLLVDVCCFVILCCYAVVLCFVCCLYGKSIWHLYVHTYSFYIEIVDNLLMLHGMLWCVFLCF